METFIKLYPFIIAAIIGSMIHIVAKFAELEKTKRTFHPSSWLKKNLYRTILGFCLSIGGVVVLAETQELTIAVSLMIGYTGDSLMKKGQKIK
jgi:hypothetical protein